MRKTQRQQAKKWKGKVMRVPSGSWQEMPQEEQTRTHAAAPPWRLHLARPLPVRRSVLSRGPACSSRWAGTSCAPYLYKWFLYRHEWITNSFFRYTQGCQGRSVGWQRAICFLSRRGSCSTNRMQTLPSISVYPERIANGPFTRMLF